MVPRTARSPRPALAREVSLTAKAVRAWADDRFVQHGHSLTTWILLQHVAAIDDPPSQRELARSMSIGGATLVRHIDRLEADGLVRRDQDPTDRRVTRISLTSAGQDRFDELARIAGGIDAELRGLLSERDERVLRSALDRLRTYTSAPPDHANPPETDAS